MPASKTAAADATAGSPAAPPPLLAAVAAPDPAVARSREICFSRWVGLLSAVTPTRNPDMAGRLRQPSFIGKTAPQCAKCRVPVR